MKLTVKMTSDWHIGTGSRADTVVDAAVQRDGDHLPFIPAKSLTGVLRDACEEVASALDAASPSKPWHGVLVEMFGTSEGSAASTDGPKSAALSIRPAHIAENLRQHLVGPAHEARRRALTITRGLTAIDSASGTAMHDHLRFVELSRGDLVLEAKLDLRDPTESQLALLWAGTQRLKALGGYRRRGAGRCTVSLEGHALVNDRGRLRELLEFDEPTTSAVAIGDAELSAEPQVESGAAPGAGDWVDIDLTLNLETPVVVPSRVLGNVTESLDYVPGGMMLGALGPSIGTFVDIGSAIAEGRIVVADAVPVLGGLEAHPTPSTWGYDKESPPTSRRAVLRTERDAPDAQFRRLKTGWAAVDPKDATVVREFAPAGSTIALGMHNTIDDHLQRPTEDVGGLFALEAIAAGTQLRSKIRVKPDRAVSPEQVIEALPSTLRLGKAKKDDYGLVTLSATPTTRPSAQNGGLSRTYVSVWCLSDVVVLGAHLGSAPTLHGLAEELSKRLGVGATPSSDSRHVRSVRQDRFNARWGLPRPSQVAVAAGSVAGFDLDGRVGSEQLAQLERSGIGERTAEGFGRVVFNHPLLEESSLSWSSDADGTDDPGETTPAVDGAELPPVIKLLDGVVLNELVQQRTVDLVGPRPPDNDARMSQLGAVQTAVRGLSEFVPDNTLATWVDAVKGNDNRKERWEPQTLTALKSLANSPNVVWQVLGISPPETSEGWGNGVRSLVTTAIALRRLDGLGQLVVKQAEQTI